MISGIPENFWEFLFQILKIHICWEFRNTSVEHRPHGPSCTPLTGVFVHKPYIQSTWWLSWVCTAAMSRLRRPSWQWLDPFLNCRAAHDLSSAHKEHITHLEKRLAVQNFCHPKLGQLEPDKLWRSDMAFGRALVFIQIIMAYSLHFIGERK